MNRRQPILRTIPLIGICVIEWVVALLVLAVGNRFTRQFEEPEGIRLTILLLAAWLIPGRCVVNVAVVAGVLLMFEPFGMGPWAGLGMYAPIFALAAWRPVDAVGPSILIGIGHGTVLTAWLTRTAPSPAVAEIVYSVLGAAVAVSLYAPSGIALRKYRLWACLPIGLWFAAVEWCRCHLPEFPAPYYLSGHVLADNRWLVQWADPVGALGLSALVAAVSASLAVGMIWRALPETTQEARTNLPVQPLLVSPPAGIAGFFCQYPSWRVLSGVGLLVAALAVGGAVRLRLEERRGGSTVRIACVTAPGVPTYGEFRVYHSALDALRARSDIELIVLPEGAGVERHDLPANDVTWLTIAQLSAYARSMASRTHLVSGLALDVPGEPDRFRDVIATFGRDGSFEARDKLWYSPVDERRPFVHWPALSRLGPYLTMSDMMPAPTSSDGSLSAGDLQLAGAVCVDSMMPDLWSWRGIKRRPDIQVVIANVIHLGGPRVQHLQSRAARVIHAVQERAPFVYVSTHRAEWIDATGRIVEPAEASPGFWVTDVPLRQ